MKVQDSVDITRPRWLPRGPRWFSRGPVIVAVVLSLALPATILAHTGRFTDVPHGAPFHDEVNAIAVAGITGGCGDGIYCPDQSVRRDAMAAFMHRGFGRVAIAQTTGPAGGSILYQEVETAGQVQINVGGVGGTTSKQYVKVDALLEAYDGSTVCPCEFHLYITDETGQKSWTHKQTLGAKESQTFTISTVFDATPGSHTYSLQVKLAGPSTAIKAGLDKSVLIATTYPFLEGSANVN